MSTAADAALQQYAVIRATVPGTESIAVLHMARHETVVAMEVAGADPAVVTMALGASGIPSSLFKSELPTPAELEHAIAAVEDEVMSASRRLPAAHALSVFTADPELHRLAEIAQRGRPSGSVISLDEVEGVFNELADIVLGRPAGSDGLPITRTFVVALVIIREVMHHLKFTTLKIFERKQPSGQPD